MRCWRAYKSSRASLHLSSSTIIAFTSPGVRCTRVTSFGATFTSNYKPSKLPALRYASLPPTLHVFFERTIKPLHHDIPTPLPAQQDDAMAKGKDAPKTPKKPGRASKPATPSSSSKKRALERDGSPASTISGTPGSTNSKRPKNTRIHHSRKASSENAKLEPGKMDDFRSFVKLWKREGQMAAYARYSQREEFRRFAMSRWVLPYYVSAFTDHENINVRPEKVLGYIADLPKEMELDEDPITKFPSQDDGLHTAPRMALAVTQMYRGLQKLAFGGGQELQQEQDSASQAFEKLTGQKPPAIDVSRVVINDFGPFPSFGEGKLEAYNRCLNVLMYVNYSISGSVWKSRYNGNWDQPTLISLNDVPHWMDKRKNTENKKCPAPDQGNKDKVERPLKPTREVKVTWLQHHRHKSARELWDYLVEEGLDFCQTFSFTVKVRPHTTAAEFRDEIRGKFEMASISAQILTLNLTPVGINVMKEKWSDVQEALWSDEKGENSFVMTLRKAEDDEVLLENELVPGLSHSVLITDGKDIQPNPDTELSSDQDDGIGDNLVDTIHKFAGSTVNYLDDMIKTFFKGRPDDLRKFFTINDVAYNVENPDDLLEFQRKACVELTYRDKPEITRDEKSMRFGKKKLTPNQLAIYNQASADGRLAAMSMPFDTEDEARHYTLHAMYNGTHSQVGLPLHPSAIALQMTLVADELRRAKYASILPGLSNTSFYPYQVSGVATCLIGMLGYIPLPKNAPKAAQDAARSLKGLALGAKFICDQTGMGKSILLLAVLYYARYHVETNKKGQRVYKFTKLVVPSGVIKQWADEIIDGFPDMKLLISYDETALPGRKYERRFIKATAMKTMDQPNTWHARHRYIFDETDPDTGLTIILTSQDTLVARTLKEEEYEETEGVKHEPPQYDENGKDIWETPPVIRKRDVGLLRGRVGIAVVDEGQRLKDRQTRRWVGFSKLEARHVFVLGATMMANTGPYLVEANLWNQDVVAQIELAWPCIERELRKASKEAQQWVKERYRSMAMYIDGVEEIQDHCDPPTVRRLLEKGTLVEQAKYFPLVADLLCLSRSMSSKIPLDFNSTEVDVYNCKDNLQPVFSETLTTRFLDDEKAEQQSQHREASKRYIQLSRAASSSKPIGKDNRPVYPVAEMRELSLTTASTKLRVFNDICKSIGHDTLTDSMSKYRENGFDGWLFVRFLCTQSKEEVPHTALGYLQFMCEGSPLLRALIIKICSSDGYLKPHKNGKLFIVDDTPLVALFIQWGLNMLGIDAALFHSGLTNAERDTLQADFNDPLCRLDVLVCLYDVGGVGRNFHRDCHNVILTSAGKNQAAEQQAGGRCVRAPQRFPVRITKIMIENSISAYKEFRKRDKALIELATRAKDPAIEQLLVDCLNEHQETIRRAQADPKNKELIGKFAEHAKIVKEQLGLLAKAVHDKNNLVDIEPVTGKRQRRGVDRYCDSNYDSNTGALKGSAQDKGKGKKIKKDAEESDEYEDDTFDDFDSIVSDDSGSIYDPTKDEQSEDRDLYKLFSDEEDLPEGDESESALAKRKAMKAARIAMRNEKQDDEPLRRLKSLLTANPDRIYTADDLNNPVYLKLALELAHCARSGVPYDNPTSIHIQYTHLPKTVQESVEDQIKREDGTREQLVEMLNRFRDRAPDGGRDMPKVPAKA
ncbi:hypothetical protein GQ44DRAFT_723010 [Phaeosphaeriaceae sp. PMI808]|nr:hypothetical protein GQ44DRAFT_723010 [Phaeosphaeriaceae sp. PMI808]